MNITSESIRADDAKTAKASADEDSGHARLRGSLMLRPICIAALAGLALVPISANAQSFAYVANQSGNNVSAYTINPSTGALTPVAGSPFAAGIAPRSVTVDPSGKFAYVADLGRNVSAHTINPSSGALTPVAGSPFADAGIGPASLRPHAGGAQQLHHEFPV
jgi:hypothetical protein